MSDLIEQIKRDREAGTPGPWAAKKSAFEVFNVDHGEMKYEIAADFTLIAALYSSDIDPDARRIARVPAMEEALLAAEKLADGFELLIQDLMNDEEADADNLADALCNLVDLRAALEAGQ